MPLNSILESSSIRDLLKYMSFDSVLLLDLDNTVIESQLELGSDQWFVQLCSHAVSVMPEEKRPIELVVALYHEIQKIVRAKTVEDNIVKIIDTLQAIGIPVMAITARDQCLNDATRRQLKDSNIRFLDHHIPRQVFSIMGLHAAQTAYYEEGIIYCGGKDKGECFRSFLNATGFNPKHVVMVDDKLKHLQHVKEVADLGRIRFNGIRYGHLDEKAAHIDIAEAHTQLFLVKHRLSPTIQDQMTELNMLPKPVCNHDIHRFFYSDDRDSTQDFVERPEQKKVSSPRCHSI